MSNDYGSMDDEELVDLLESKMSSILEEMQSRGLFLIDKDVDRVLVIRARRIVRAARLFIAASIETELNVKFEV